jgi:hypothetical protein
LKRLLIPFHTSDVAVSDTAPIARPRVSLVTVYAIEHTAPNFLRLTKPPSVWIAYRFAKLQMREHWGGIPRDALSGLLYTAAEMQKLNLDSKPSIG